MLPELQELYYYETEHDRLNFDADPVYREKMARALAEPESLEKIWAKLEDLMER